MAPETGDLASLLRGVEAGTSAVAGATPDPSILFGAPRHPLWAQMITFIVRRTEARIFGGKNELGRDAGKRDPPVRNELTGPRGWRWNVDSYHRCAGAAGLVGIRYQHCRCWGAWPNATLPSVLEHGGVVNRRFVWTEGSCVAKHRCAGGYHRKDFGDHLPFATNG